MEAGGVGEDELNLVLGQHAHYFCARGLRLGRHDGDLLAEPEIITRGFIYVKDSEELLQDLRNLTMSTAEAYRGKRGRDLNELKGAIRSAVSNYLFKATKRSPMVLPVITKL